MVIVEERFVYTAETHLTVMKTSLFYPGDGFAAYDSNGQLVFRVDSYGPDTRELVLMDQYGWPSLHNRWEGYLGERRDNENQKVIFSARRSSLIGRSSVTVELFGDQTEVYRIEGQFGHRNCRIYDSAMETKAEIRRKVDVSTNVMLGKDVFLVKLKPGFDGAFAMGLVLVLDQINGGDGVVDLYTDDCNSSS
ncbi:putative tubby-like protein [Helianthus anomalus]